MVERRGMRSIAKPLPAPAGAAVRVGADLRVARERLGWSLIDIATGLRIQLGHLEALEDGRLGLLPGNAYAIGYVRAYARMLGLDPGETVRRFKTEAMQAGRRTELVFPTPMPGRGLPAGAVMLLGLVLSVGAYVGWYRLSGDGRLPPEAVMAIPQRLAPLAQQATLAQQTAPPAGGPSMGGTSLMGSGLLTRPTPPMASSPPIGNNPMGNKTVGSAAAVARSVATTAAPDALVGGSATGMVPGGGTPPGNVLADSAPLPPPQRAAGTPSPDLSPADVVAAPSVRPISPSSAAAAQVGNPIPDEVLAPPALAPPLAAVGPTAAALLAAPAAANPLASPLAEQSRIVLHASADAWVQVRDRGGGVLLNRILKAGEAWNVPRQDNLLLTTGNAGGTEVLLDGTATPSLGASGAVRRDLPLDPDLIRDGRLSGAVAAQMASAHPRQ